MGAMKKIENMEKNLENLSPDMFTFAEYDANAAERTGYSNYSYWASTWRVFTKNKVAMFFLTLLIALMVFTFIQPYLPGQKNPIEVYLSEEIFYNAKHPYSWALLSSLPQLGVKGEPLYSIKGTPPNLFNEIKGDAFAPRNPQALKIDFEIRPPYFEVSPTHRARTWLLDPRAPKVEPPALIARMFEKWKEAAPDVQ